MTFTLVGTAELQAVLMKLGAEAPKAAGSALVLEAERIMVQAKALAPVDMAALRTSGHVQPPKVTATNATVTLGFGGAAAPYALYVHEGIGPAVGRPKFMPPVSALRGWVRRNIGGTEKEVDRIAFLVARAIGRRGLKPTKFLERPMLAAKAGFEGRMAKHLGSWLARPRAVKGK